MRFPKQSDNFKISLGIMDKKLYMYFSIIIIILCTHEKEHAIWVEKTTGASIYLSIFRPRLFVLFFFYSFTFFKVKPTVQVQYEFTPPYKNC